MPPTPTPEQITEAMRGNTRAFRAIVEAHQGFVFAVAYRFVNNAQDAEDITQDVFVRLWKGLPGYRHEVKLTTWLYRIVANRCLDFLKSGHGRQRKNSVEASAESGLVAATTPDAEYKRQELTAQVHAAARLLKPKQQAVFILRDLEGLSADETMEALDMSRDQVKSNLFEARKKVMKYLKDVYQTNEPDFL